MKEKDVLKRLVCCLVLCLSLSVHAEKKDIPLGTWGSGSGQFGTIVSPDGRRLGPRALCATSKGKQVYVLDTFNDAAIKVFLQNGDYQHQIPNLYPSPGYAAMEIEDDRYLYLLDVMKNSVNRVDLQEGTQALLASDVLGVSSEIAHLGRDLRGVPFIRDASGQEIVLRPEFNQPLLSFQVEDTPEPNRKRVFWRNTRLGFMVEADLPISQIHFLNLLPNGAFVLGVEQEGVSYMLIRRYTPEGDKVDQMVMETDPARDGSKAIYVDKVGRYYRLIYKDKGVLLRRW